MFKVSGIVRHRLITDGNGVTTLVALFACPLKCKYCINMDILGSGRYRELTPKELLDEVMIDYCYFVATKGGITFGGGEPLLQINEIMEFLDILPEGVNVNIETSLNVEIDSSVMEKLCDKGVRFIVDIKAQNNVLYKEYTGKDRGFLVKNLNVISEKKYNDNVKIRIPVIPNLKDKKVAGEEAAFYEQEGFTDIEVFNYIIRDYMKGV